jgi:hypothetical protein
MILPEDIDARIENDFPSQDDRDLVKSIISALSVDEKIRVARCILFIADGDLDRLGKLEDLANTDYRDVIMAGEYEYPSNKKLRDFNDPFNT